MERIIQIDSNDAKIFIVIAVVAWALLCVTHTTAIYPNSCVIIHSLFICNELLKWAI